MEIYTNMRVGLRLLQFVLSSAKIRIGRPKLGPFPKGRVLNSAHLPGAATKRTKRGEGWGGKS